ncbi:MAG: helix-turn-helix domain-containing protein [Chitinivibrionales bacterium]|nr:helix-turn-helix domain-containing protein [Chitinivibrionales bacterium]MBD3396000.1 helix-turn-helix domain-containing protein [Chitinivibrionales bacterium]
MFLPEVRGVRINEGPSIRGTFLDAEYVFHYIAAGEWEFLLESEQYLVKPHTVLILQPNVLHFVRPLSGSSLVQYVIHFEDRDSAIAAQGRSAFALIPKGVRQQVSALFMSMYDEWKKQGNGADYVCAGIMTELLGLTIRHQEEAGHEDTPQHPGWVHVANALTFIRTNYSDPELTIAGIAEHTGLSVPYFSRLFKQFAGVAPIVYLHRLRVEKAQVLLVRSELNCSQIAEATGFSGIHLFSKVFKKVTGVSPLGWRKRLYSMSAG